MMKDLCLILSGGEYCEVPVEYREAGMTIACDKGWEYAGMLGLIPDLVVGDFDSSPIPENGVPVEILPTRKDDTDTMYAVSMALDRGYRNIVISCALGGRLDHMLANLQSAAYVAAQGGTCRIVGEDTEVTVYSASEQIFPRHQGWSLSLFAVSDVCTGVTVQGTKFDCREITLANTFPLGVSNVWEAEEARVSVKSGILMAVQSRLREGEHI